MDARDRARGRGLRAGLTLVALVCVGASLATVAYVERTYLALDTGVPSVPARVALLGGGALEPWRRAAGRAGLEIETIETLGTLGPEAPAVERFGALVVLDAGSLDEAGWSALDRAIEAGRGVILVGGDPPHLERLFPGAPFRAPEPARALRVAGRGPLVAGLDPSDELAPPAPLRSVTLEGPGSLALGPSRSVALEGRVLDAPVVWLGVDPAELRPAGRAERLIENALRRAVHRPVAHLRPWPDGASAAAVVSASLGHDDADALSQLLHRNGSVVFALADVTEDRTELVRRLGRRAEIAHAPGHADAAPGARTRLETAARRPVTGLWSDVDPAAATALVGSGYRYVATARLEGDAPRLIEAAGDALVALPHRASGSAPGSAPLELRLGRMLGEFAELEARDGIYVLSLTSGWPLRATARLLDELAARRAWVASGTEAAAWWRSRARVDLALEEPRPGRAVLVLHNRGARAVTGATARVYLPAGARVPTRVETDFLAGAPALRVASDRRWIDVVAPRMEPGDRARYAFRY